MSGRVNELAFEVETINCDVIEVVEAIDMDVDVELGNADVLVPFKILAAACSSKQSTLMPAVSFFGTAKHFVPVAQTLMTKLPALSQLPTFPDTQAIDCGWHAERNVMVENKALESCACFRLVAY